MLTLPLYCTGSNGKLGGAWASTVQCLHSTAEGPGSGLSLSLVPDGPFQGVLHSWCSSTAGRRHQAHWKWVSREDLREGGGSSCGASVVWFQSNCSHNLAVIYSQWWPTAYPRGQGLPKAYGAVLCNLHHPAQWWWLFTKVTKTKEQKREMEEEIMGLDCFDKFKSSDLSKNEQVGVLLGVLEDGPTNMGHLIGNGWFLEICMFIHQIIL